MRSRYDPAIEALSEEIATLTSALRVLERKRADELGAVASQNLNRHITFYGGGQQVALPLSSEPAKPPTNEETVDAILRTAYPKGFGVPDIIKRGRFVGRELNKNSVRWVLKHGVDAGRYVKNKNGGRGVEYAMSEAAMENPTADA